MKKLFLLMMCLLLPLGAMAKDDDLNYEIESAGVGASGMTLVKVSVYVKKVKNASSELLKKAAVHGIIFRGVSASNVTGYSKQRALVTSPAAEEQYADFFDSFFADGGRCMAYATMVNATTETVKVGKEYRVSAVVNVSTDALKKDLKDAGVIKGMVDGF